jgi:predicted RecB family nuclease
VQLVDGTVIVSATDLIGYLACDHLATLELGRLQGLWERPPDRADDPTVKLMQEHGDRHEREYLERLRAAGRTVREISKEDLRTPDELVAAQAATLVAMEEGVDVIYQATFFDGRWRGHADFLLRVETPSRLGPWSYEIADTKLSRRVKAAAIIQMCVYADGLDRLQGRPPEQVHVVTGDGTSHPHRLADYSAFFRTAKRRFESRVFGNGNNPPTYPEPVEHCAVCVWYPMCMDRRRRDDHLSLVAGMSRVHAERLRDDRLPTLTALAELPPDQRVAEMNPRPLTRLREQARLQLAGRRAGSLLYELIPPLDDEPGRGLAALPEPSPLDVFFDIEADPWAIDGGLEYLLGVVEDVDGEPVYHTLWGHDRATEKASFEAFIDLVIERLDRDPAMHVYHYAPYEPTAVKRLMQRHATREDEVDRLLRGGVFVDLYQVVRQGIRASVESYSLKKIEKFYLPEREGPVTEAGFSVVQYEEWLATGEQRLLDELAAYNRDDCVSTFQLRSWVENLRVGAISNAGWKLPRPEPEDGQATEQLAARQAETNARAAALTRDVPADTAERTDEQQARWLVAQLLDWHRREEKPAWWLWFELVGKSPEELVDSPDAIGDLRYVDEIGQTKRSVIQRYSFDPAQDYKIKVGDKPLSPDPDPQLRPRSAGEVVALDDVAGTIDLVRGIARADEHPRALIPPAPFGGGAMRDALGRVGDWVIEHGIAGPGRYHAVRDLILKAPPRIDGQSTGDDLLGSGEGAIDAAKRIALTLDETVLPVQGPPGTGKTWTGARMIAALVGAGRKVGVTAQSHRAISNMLNEVARAARGAGVTVRIVQKCDRGEDASTADGVTLTNENAEVEDGLAAGRYDVAGGTSWLFARGEMEDRLDVLFVDEAGQVSLANVVSMGGCARSFVLLGDPNQLPQVSQGIHPEGAEKSALEHVIGEALTIPPNRGLFLPTTYRLHPLVNDYVSEIFYDGRLAPADANERQRLGPSTDARAGSAGAGVRYVPVVHDGNSSRSRQEAMAVAGEIAALIGREWTDRDGRRRWLTADDILVVAPYNAHVQAIRQAVVKVTGRAVRIGTVDKFQGQEAPVAIYSMATSSPADAPRDIDFLYSGNRLNVAVSRASGLAVLVCSPELLLISPRTPEQLRLANALCRLVEVAAEQAAGDERAQPAAQPGGPEGAPEQLELGW